VSLEDAEEIKKFVLERCSSGDLGKDECTYILNCIEFPSACGITDSSTATSSSESVAPNSLQMSSQLAAPAGAGGTAAMAMLTGNDVAYEYDELNRLTRVASYTSDVTFSYDAAGNRTQVVVPEPRGAAPLALSILLLAICGAHRQRVIQRSLRSRSQVAGLFLVFLTVSLTFAHPVLAQNLPGVRMAQPPATTAYAVGQGPSATTSSSIAPLFAGPATQASTSTEVTPEIQELARALKYDVDLIYEYVHNEIEFTPLWASSKGAMGALLDKSGNDFDQASLMIALLRESGYTASFVYGNLRLDGPTLINWLGVSDNADVVARLFSASGRDTTRSVAFFQPPGNTIAVADMERVWVRVDIDGTDYVFDPALKTHTVTPAIALKTAMGYSQASFLSGALSGATIGTDSIQNINQTNLEASLTGYADNLAAEIRTSYPAATLEDIVGGRTIDPLTSFPRVTSFPTEQTIYEVWTVDIPAAYRNTIQIQLPGIDETFNSDSLSGKRLTVFYESNQPVLRLDGVTIATGTTVTAGSTQPMQLNAEHGYASTFADSGGPVNIKAGGSFLILNGWSELGSGRVEHHERRERANQHAGGTLLSEPVLGEALAVFATSWIAQTNQTCRMAARISDTHCFQHHRLGVTGQNSSPYIDSPDGIISTVSNADDLGQARAVFFNYAGHSSAFEAGVIEQIQPDRAVSTVELIGIASDQSSRIFDATTANFATIQPQLVNYTAASLARVQSFLDAGARVILPEDGGLIVDQYTGVGFLGLNQSTALLSFTISGGLSGGFTTTTNSTLDVDTDNQINSAGNNHSSDPIDLVTGDFLFEQVDLTVGSQPFPLGLAFRKSYNSGSRFKDGALGLGWTHNFELTAELGSDGFQGLGEDSPIDAVAAIVEQVVSIDLLTGSEPLDQVVLSMLTQRWFMEHLIDNAVTVSEPTNTSVFIHLADGTFNPPPGSASDLTVLPAGTYQLENKHGLVLSFHNDGNIDFSLDPNGNQVVWSYNSGILQNVADAAGHVLSFTYTGGRISSVSDGTRNFGYAYDAAGNLTTVTDANSENTTFQYQSDGLLNRVFTPANPANARVFNTFNSLGHVETQLDALGNLYTYHIAPGSRSEEVDPLLNSTVTYYNDRGKILGDIDALGFETTFDYDGEERVIATVAPEGNFVQFEYDDLHNLTTETTFPKPGSPDAPIVREFTYEPTFNKVETVTDPRLNVTTFSYDGDGNLQTITQPQVGGQSPTTTFTYNSRGQVLTTTDPEGTITSFSYAPTTADLLSTTADSGGGGLGLVTSMTYNAAGDRITQTDPRLNTVAFAFDNMRRVTQTTSPAPFSFITMITNDEEGNVTEVSRATGDVLVPWQTTTTTYTLSGKVNTVTDPDLGATLAKYDGRDRISRVTDAESQLTQIFYDARGNLDHVIDATGVASQQYTYAANGQVASVADANGNTTGYRYDDFDRLEFTDFPDSDFEQLTYDAASNVVNKRTRSGPSITFSHDALNRLATKVPFGVPSVAYDYDLASRLVEVTDGAGLTSYGYDALGRRSSVIHPGGETLGYAYDDSGNRSRLDYPDGHFVTYEYDEMNRLQRIADLGVTSIAFFTYDALSRLVTTNRLNNATTTYTYEIDDDVESVSHLFNGGTTADFHYAYNAVHNRKFTSPSDPQFVFDFLTPVEANYTNNNMNQATAVVFEPQGAGQGVAYSLGYDLNGNLGSGLNSHGYGHNIENRLISATTPDDSISFTYDAFGTRTSKTVDGVATNYILDGNQVIAEYDGSAQLLRRYVYAGLDQPIQMVTPSATYYYHSDALGSVIALSDTGANLVETYALGPYGQVEQPSALGNPYLFTGREYDSETGLYYYRNRYYDPELGRFMEPDLIGFADGLNLYAYVGGNPVNLIDPLGLFQTGSTGLDLGSPNSSSGARSIAEVRALNDIFNFENTVGPVTPEKAALFAQLTEAFGNLVVAGTGGSLVGNPAVGETLEGIGRSTIQLGQSTANAGRIAGTEVTRLGQQGLTRALNASQRGGFVAGTIAGLGQSFSGIPVPNAPGNRRFNEGVSFGDAVGDLFQRTTSGF